MPEVSLILSWRDGVSLVEEEPGALRVEGLGTRLTFRPVAAAILAALQRLAALGEDEDRLCDEILDAGGPDALAAWYYDLQRLAQRGLIVRSVVADGRRLATLVPFEGATPMGAEIAPDVSYTLCRFAYLRRIEERLVLESPRVHARLVLDDHRTCSLVGALAVPGTPTALARRTAGLPEESIGPLLTLLNTAGFLRQPPDEDEPAALQAWEFHDLLFHARSRKGRSDAPFGATYRLAGLIEPPPGAKRVEEGRVYLLPRPDPVRLRDQDPPLSRVVEERRSVRTYGPDPIAIEQLGEFLWRVARVDEVRPAEIPTPAGPVATTVAARPYPFGGGLYELEFYVAIASCAGLPEGLYHYDAQGHRLVLLAPRNRDVDHLVRDAAGSAGIDPETVQVLVILAARFARLSWKYASIAYSLVLKHVGVVYQSMYLAATAMGLAPCALGGGDSDLFARAARTGYYEETSVGEFLLGSRPPDDLTGR